VRASAKRPLGVGILGLVGALASSLLGAQPFSQKVFVLVGCNFLIGEVSAFLAALRLMAVLYSLRRADR